MAWGKAKKRDFKIKIKQPNNSQIKTIKFDPDPTEREVNDLLLFYLIRYAFDFKERIIQGKSSVVNQQLFLQCTDKVMIALEGLRESKTVEQLNTELSKKETGTIQDLKDRIEELEKESRKWKTKMNKANRIVIELQKKTIK